MDVTITQSVEKSSRYFPAYVVHVTVVLDERERHLFNTYGALPVVEVLQAEGIQHPGPRTNDMFSTGFRHQKDDVFEALAVSQRFLLAIEQTALRWKQALAFAGTRELHIDTSEVSGS